MRWFKKLHAQAVVVHLHSGASIHGFVGEVYRDHVVLHSATLLGDRSQKIDGRAIAARDEIAWVQVPDPREDIS